MLILFEVCKASKFYVWPLAMVAITGSGGAPGMTGAKGNIRNIQEDELLQRREENVWETNEMYFWFIAMKYRFPIPGTFGMFFVELDKITQYYFLFLRISFFM